MATVSFLSNSFSKNLMNLKQFAIDTDYLSVVLINAMYIVILLYDAKPLLKGVAALCLMAINLVVAHGLISMNHSKDMKIYELINAIELGIDKKKLKFKHLKK